MPSISRRTLILGGGAALGAGALVVAGRSQVVERPVTTTVAGRAADDLDRLVDAILSSDEASSIVVARDALARGVPEERWLTAVLLSPIASGGDESDVHACMVVPSVWRACRGARDAHERCVLVLWATDNVHPWTRARRRGRAPPAHDADPRSALARALAAGDTASADAAAASLVASEPSERATRFLRDAVTRARADVHSAIWAAQASRWHASLGAHTPDAARSVARYAARAGRPMPVGEPIPTDDADTTPSAEILRRLRDDATAPLAGSSARAIWSALALLAVETRLANRSATGLGVHRTTLLAAMHRIWRDAAPETAPTLLSRAVRWVLEVAPPLADGAPDPLVLEPASGDPLALAADDPVGAFRAALAAVADDEGAFLEAIRARVATLAADPHDFKRWDAVLDIAPHLDATARACLLASMAADRIARAREPWSRADEARALVRAIPG